MEHLAFNCLCFWLGSDDTDTWHWALEHWISGCYRSACDPFRLLTGLRLSSYGWMFNLLNDCAALNGKQMSGLEVRCSSGYECRLVLNIVAARWVGVGVDVDVGLCKVRLGQRFPCEIFVYLHSFGKKSIEENLATTPLEIRSRSIGYLQEWALTKTYTYIYICLHVYVYASAFSQYEVGNFPVARTKKVFQADNDGETHTSRRNLKTGSSLSTYASALGTSCQDNICTYIWILFIHTYIHVQICLHIHFHILTTYKWRYEHVK